MVLCQDKQDERRKERLCAASGKDHYLIQEKTWVESDTYLKILRIFNFDYMDLCLLGSIFLTLTLLLVLQYDYMDNTEARPSLAPVSKEMILKESGSCLH